MIMGFFFSRIFLSQLSPIISPGGNMGGFFLDKNWEIFEGWE